MAPKTTIYPVAVYNLSLSAREVALLSALERERVSSLTTDEARRRLGPGAKKVVSSLNRKGALQRIRRGLYLVRPFRTLTRATTSSTIVAAATLLRDVPHYFGGLWACSFHHLTRQAYASVIDAFVARRRESRFLGTGRLVFRVIPLSQLRHGMMTTTIEGVEIRVSTLERTLLDALDHPLAAGGVENAVRMVSASLKRADHRALTELAARLAKPQTLQRLGVLLERAKVRARLVAPLRRRLEPARPLTAMFPARARTGPINVKWKVIENDE